MKIKKIVSYMIVSVIFFNIFSPLALAIEGSESYITFENKIFENEIINQGIDTDNDGHISIEEANNVQQISLSSNCTSFNDLKYFTNLSEFHIGSIWDTEQKIDFQNLTENLNKFNPMNLNIQSYFDIGTIELNSNGEINLTNVSPIIAALNDNKSKLYNENLTFKVDTDYDDSNNENLGLSFDKSKYVINVDTTKSGENEILFTAENSSPSSFYSFKIKYKVILSNDTSEEVEFADNNLKQYILDNNDYNFDGKITEYDMEQITNLSVTSGEISSLEGLQYATNLNYLYISVKNNNCDISQLSQLTNLNNLNIINGNLRDYLKNLNNLKSITCQYGIIDINNLNVGLESFNYSGSNLSNIESLENYSNLNYISIYNYNDYDESKKINYNFVEKLNKLSYFTASDNNGTIDMEKFNNLEKLYTIQLSKFTLTNLNLLKEYSPKKSYIIGLDSCKVNDISFVKNFTSFYSLNLRNNSITDISPLNGIKISGGNYIDLKGNAINPNEEKNAKTIQYFKDNNITYYIDDYDDSEEIEFKDENFKKCLLKSNYPKIDTNNDGKIQKGELKDITRLTISEDVKDISGIENATNLKEISFDCYQKNDMDLSPLKNLTNIERITFMSEFTKMYGFDFLSNSKNFKEICLCNFPHSFDFSNFSNLSNLESISIDINQKDGDDNQLQNLSSLKKLTKLSSLDLYAGYGTIHTEELAKLKQIKTLKIDGNIDNYNNIYSIPNLTYLKLGDYSNDRTIDLKGIGNLKNLETIELNGNIKNILNIKELNNVSSLKLLKLDLNTYYDYKFHYSNVESYKEYMKEEQEFVDSLQTLNCEKIQICPSSKSYVGSIQLGQKKTIKFEDISPLIKAIVTPGNKLYNSNFEISTNSNDSHIKVDNTNKTITINSNGEVGEQSEDIIAKTDYGNYNYCTTNIPILWKNITQGDTTKKIDIPDKNLKECLLNNYDIDNDKEITENDMVNIVSLDIQNKNISSLEGLQYATNMKILEASYNRISNLSPILNLEKLAFIGLNNNILTDISSIKNAKWSNITDDESIGFYNNFIDFKEGNNNYNAFKQWMYKNIPNGKESLIFCDTIKQQNYGNVEDIDSEVILDNPIKNKLLQIGADQNNDNIITRKELYDISSLDIADAYSIDLSNLKIKNLSGLEYLNIYNINLSNNEISDITSITKNHTIDNINLSYNKIKDIAGIDNCSNIKELNLSNNDISNIEPITNMFRMQEDPSTYYWDYGYRIMSINLSNNNIENIDCVKDWRNMHNLDLSNNMISDISQLSNYDFEASKESENDEHESDLKIDLSNNYIDVNNNNNKKAKNVFDTKGAKLILDNQLTRLEKTDVKTGAIIETNTNVVPENVELEIDKLDTASETNKNLVEIIDKLPNKTTNTKYEIFNIKLVDNTKKEVQPNGKVTVYLPIPNGYSSKVKIYNIDPTNSKTPYTLLDTSIETIDNKKYAKFKTTHFSYYSMVNSELIGDVNGDGKVNITDVALINSHVKKVKILTGEELSRADVNNDGKVNITDVALVNSHVKKVKLLW